MIGGFLIDSLLALIAARTADQASIATRAKIRMGLAEPRKRIKISHDPRNLTWSAADDSFGQRLMQKHGWKSGEALGARKGLRESDTDAAKVRITVKDDTLGLGASLKSKDVEHQRTGLDAFQGLLGRLNARDEKELKEVEKKIEDRKLTRWTQGRWGGMVFVPGGLLVQKNPADTKSSQVNEESETFEFGKDKPEEQSVTESADAARRKAEKRQQKLERRARKEAKRLRKAQTELNEASELETTAEDTELSSGVATPVSQSDGINMHAASEKLKNGRHILRGRNIQAKRLAFSDMKMLDEIFMKRP